MNKRFRMLIALFTALSMLFAFSISAAAASFPDIDEDDDIFDAAELLAELDIYQGYPDGSFGPDNPITRAEFAAIVTRALDREGVAASLADLPTGYADDSDIDSWARGYINFASNQGIIQGYPDGTFRPNANVTFAEAYAMLARMLGLDKAATGSWPGNYIGLAATIGLSDGISGAANVPITRAEMAQATVNALFADYKWDSDDGLVRSDNEDGAESLIVKRHGWSKADWATKVPGRVVTGKYDRITASGDIRIDGANYAVEDYDDLVVELNKEEQDDDWTAAKLRNLIEDVDDNSNLSHLALSLNSDGKVTKVNIVADTYRNALLDRVTVNKDETDFGTIRIGAKTIKVDDDTDVLLNGRTVNLKALKDEFDEFQDEWDEESAVTTVRTLGNDDGNNATAIYVSVITDDTVSGKVQARGTDSGGAYVRIDGSKIYHKLADAPEVGKTYTLLLGHDGKAYVVLSNDSIDDDEFYAKLLGIEEVDDDEFIVTVELADGSQQTLNAENIEYDSDNPADNTPELREAAVKKAADDEFVVYVEIDAGNDEITLTAVVPDAEDAIFSRTTAARVYYYLDENDYQANNEQNLIRYADGVFVYDADEEEYVSLGSLRKGDVIDVYSDGTDVYLIVIVAQEDDNGAPAPAPAGSWANPSITAITDGVNVTITIDFGEPVRFLNDGTIVAGGHVEDGDGNLRADGIIEFTETEANIGGGDGDEITITIWANSVQNADGEQNVQITRKVVIDN